MGKKQVPAIRFQGFTDAWEQRKVGETITEVPRPIELNDDQEYQLVTVKRRNEGVVSRGRMYGKNILVKNYFEICAGDYLISKRQLVHGANGIVPESLDKAVVSNEYMACVSNQFITAEFLAMLSKTKSLQKDFFLSSYGVDIEKLVFDVDDWKKRFITIPKVKEQEKICECFTQLDHLITLHQRKYEKLLKVKKSMLEKVFPRDGADVPEIRFDGFTDAWEQRKLSELAERTYGGGTPTTSNEVFWNGDIPWIQSSDVVDGKLFGVTPRKHITQSGLNSSAAQLIPKNSIAIITRVGVGKLAFMPYSYATSQDFLSLSKLNTEPFFTVYSCYKKLQSELNSVQGTSIKGITKDELLSKTIMVPEYAEQQQIGVFFSNLDHLITLHQRKLEKLKNIKKSLLEKMFV